MRLLKFTLWYFFAICVSIGFYACSDDGTDDNGTVDPPEQPGKYAGFDFKTTQEYDIRLTASSATNTAIDGVYIELFTEKPIDTAGLFVPNYEKVRFFKGLTNPNGYLECKLNPPASADSLYVLTYHIGLPQLTTVALESEIINIELGGDIASKSTTKTSVKVDEIPDVDEDNGYYILGDWGKKGKPEYLEAEDDEITNDFLERVNASVPETKPLTETHPEYLENSDDGNIVMVENGEVWVTFVHEGAGWKNALGYYTYPTENPPASVDDIEDMTIIFPNVSMGNKDEIQSGNKVQLLYLNQEEEEYEKLFPAGRTIGWFLVAHGWQDGKREVDEGVYTHYSNIYLNIEETEDLQKHNIVLFDDDTERFVLAFEDVARNSSACDNDFNDAVFYATFNPITAVQKEDYQAIDDENDDTDNDGTSDEFDEYPEDPTKAFNNYYVAENEFGTLAFEDLWPAKGDYDFNDLVVAYNFNQITNSDNNVVEIQAKMQVRAIGASKKNAFGFSLDVAPNAVASVTGQQITGNYLNIASNGTENGQSKATIICFDDPYNIIEHPGGGSGVNTSPSAPYATPETMEMVIVMSEPVQMDNIGTPPFNPFIIVDQERAMEVHLPNHEPTDLADQNMFGSYDDDSNAGAAKYYVSDQFLPWAINLPVTFDYPAEKKSILNTYNHFDSWASSNGELNKDWYMDESGYRNSSNIYSK
ncbi:LruC domain-containing protein [Marinifilum caeruleilacunae]|uniref:LruC domain-containing protein n=1 Tax=Marinifilum caeruleilacunae TaxID=2499076 RepID=A0ABX1X0F4_9BACT|nr:LruC domain-containing protein [Marinifilum caeruleilacunae]NOU61779.1 LruC domain-containing protein [Marinifilum caeruleilacunae]